MTPSDWILHVSILAFSVPALCILVIGGALVFVGSPILRRCRTQIIRTRDDPPWERWVAEHYPKATRKKSNSFAVS